MDHIFSSSALHRTTYILAPLTSSFSRVKESPIFNSLAALQSRGITNIQLACCPPIHPHPHLHSHSHAPVYGYIDVYICLLNSIAAPKHTHFTHSNTVIPSQAIMENTFISYIIPLLLLPLSLYFIAFIRKQRFRNLPLGSNGYPIIGENMEFALLGPQKFIKDRMEKYSPEVFRTSLLGEKMAIFCGPQGNKFLFTNDNKLLTSWWPKSLKKALLSPDFSDRDLKEVTAVRRSFHHEILRPEALKQYVPVMDALAREHLDQFWSPDSIVKVFPLAKTYTFQLACRLFLSLVDPEEIKRLSEPFNVVVGGVFSLPLDLPGTPYNRAVKGGRMVREELMRIIRERRKQMMGKKESEGRDLLSKMLLVRYDNGEYMSDVEVANNFVGLLVASFETTSSAVTAVVNYLAELPHIYEGVFRGKFPNLTFYSVSQI